MNEKYTKLMLQQHLSKEADAAFYEKLENAQLRKRHRPVLRAAAIAACICLLIPFTVLAVENIFGIALIARFNEKTDNGRDTIGYQAQFKNLENIPITEFSEFAQNLEEGVEAYYDSWEEAEKDVGIDLISNSVLTDGNTYPMKKYYTGKNPPAEHCQGLYYVADGQLYAVSIGAFYSRNNVSFEVTATMTTDHPKLTEEIFQIYHGSGIKYYQANRTDISVEQHTTKSGIPMTIVVPTINSHSHPEAYFAVNNVSYKVELLGWAYNPDTTDQYEVVKSVLMEVLEGFTLE